MPIRSSHGLETKGRGRIEELRAWEGNERERARAGAELGEARMRKWLGEKESSLNDVGPKNGWPSFNRSDRLPRPVRLVCPRLT